MLTLRPILGTVISLIGGGGRGVCVLPLFMHLIMQTTCLGLRLHHQGFFSRHLVKLVLKNSSIFVGLLNN